MFHKNEEIGKKGKPKTQMSKQFRNAMEMYFNDLCDICRPLIDFIMNVKQTTIPACNWFWRYSIFGEWTGKRLPEVNLITWEI